MNPTYRKINLTSFGEKQEEDDAAASKITNDAEAKRKKQEKELADYGDPAHTPFNDDYDEDHDPEDYD